MILYNQYKIIEFEMNIALKLFTTMTGAAVFIV